MGNFLPLWQALDPNSAATRSCSRLEAKGRDGPYRAARGGAGGPLGARCSSPAPETRALVPRERRGSACPGRVPWTPCLWSTAHAAFWRPGSLGESHVEADPVRLQQPWIPDSQMRLLPELFPQPKAQSSGRCPSPPRTCAEQGESSLPDVHSQLGSHEATPRLLCSRSAREHSARSTEGLPPFFFCMFVLSVISLFEIPPPSTVLECCLASRSAGRLRCALWRKCLCPAGFLQAWVRMLVVQSSVIVSQQYVFQKTCLGAPGRLRQLNT